MFMCVVNLKSVNKLDLTWKQSFLITQKKMFYKFCPTQLHEWRQLGYESRGKTWHETEKKKSHGGTIL